MSEERVILFAKAPIPGTVKTRLNRSPRDAARLHEAFVRDVVHRHSSAGRRITVWVTGSVKHALWASLNVAVRQQVGRSLGERLLNAFNEEMCDGHPVVALGTDSPTLPPAYVDEAFTQLRSNDAVIGPAFDGGYYLLGMRQLWRELFPNDMPWGTNQVLDRTLRAAEKNDRSMSVLPFWYDVDRPADLEMMRAHFTALDAVGLPTPSATIACLAHLDHNE